MTITLQTEIEQLLRDIALAWRRTMDGASVAEIEELWSAVEERLHRALLEDAAAWTAAGLEDLLADALEELENDARAVLSDAGRAKRDAERILPLLRVRVQALRQIVRAVAGRPRRDEVPQLVAELKDIEHDFDTRATIHRTGSWQRSPRVAEVERVFADVIRARITLLLAKSYAVNALGAADIVGVFRLWRGLDQSRRRILETGGGDRAFVEADHDLDRESARLEALILEALASGEAAAVKDAATTIALEFMDEVNDARLAATDQEPIPDLVVMRTIASATKVRRQAGRVASRLERATDGAGIDVARASGRLGRSIARLANDRADRVLKRRIAAVFGKKLARAWEIAVFWLVIAALVLIIVDHYVDETDAEGMPWYVWGDTAICFILLFDFSVRLVLTPRRWSYFIRHSLTGFFAFLPFGFVANLERVPFAKAAWFVEVGKSLKILRAAQPIIAFFRLILFMSRAADRVVEALSWLLNRKIVFFAEAVKGEALPTLLKRARDLDGWIRRSAARILADLSPADRRESAELRLRLVAARTRRGVVGDGLGKRREPGDQAPTELDAEEVIKSLRELDETNIHDAVTWDVAQRLLATMRVCRWPIVRNLSVVRYIMGARGEGDAAGVVARLAHVAADTLDLAQKTIHWFADLYGAITGAQFLDRLGMQIVKATARPARRMILFGSIACIAVLFVKLLRLNFLNAVADAFFRFLSTPVLVLGFLCLLPLLLGTWLRKIAGAAADFHDRVAEAQFLALTEVTKEELAESHLKTLAERVVLPEARLVRSLSGQEGAALIERVQAEGTRHPFMAHATETVGVGRTAALVDWNRVDTMLLFYRDFIDGAFFHKNDVKIANMMLGNLTLENIRRDRLHWTAKDRKRLEKLDIGRAVGGVGGPYVWFNFITTSVAQQTARLIIEYNQNCIPLDEWENAREADKRAFEDWFAQRTNDVARKKTGRTAVLDAARPPAEDDVSYRTTEFTALHFLGLGSRRDEAVAKRFGARVSRLMAADRENLIRGIFGTFPMHELPPETRTFNPYEFYRRYFARGRAFLFPFVVIWQFGRMVRRLCSWILRVVRETMNPDLARGGPLPNRCGFEVARRKIYRMRRPIVIEAMRLRAAFDVEYLGLTLPNGHVTIPPAEQAAADLRRLNASEREWEEFRVRKSQRERQLRFLASLLREALEAEPRERLQELLEPVRAQSQDPAAEKRRAEALRAVTLAFLVDHQGSWSLVEARRDAILLLERVVASPAASRRPARFVRKNKDLEAALDLAWPLIAGDRSGERPLRTAYLTALRRERGGMREKILRLAEFVRSGGRDPSQFTASVLETVAVQPSSWTEQVVAVRTVQTLAVLDVTSYETVVRRLGNYSVEEGAVGAFDAPEARL